MSLFAAPPTKLILRSRETGEVLGEIEIAGRDLVPSSVYARKVMEDARRREIPPRPLANFLRRLHADLRYDDHVSAGLIPYRSDVPKGRRRSRMLEQLYLQDLGWSGVIRGDRIAYWVRPQDDPTDSVRRFSHEEAVALARLPVDPDELESWGAPYKPVEVWDEPPHSEGAAHAPADTLNTAALGQGPRRQTDPLPMDVRATLLALIDSDPRIADREAELTANRLHRRTPVGPGGDYTPAQRQNARGFARKDLALELGIWKEAATDPEIETDSLIRPRRRSASLPAEQSRSAQSPWQPSGSSLKAGPSETSGRHTAMTSTAHDLTERICSSK